MHKTHGFTLVYTLLIVSAVFILVGIAFSGAIFESRTARTQAESMKAFFAADTGIECVRFLQTYFAAFTPTSPAAPYDCDGPAGPMASFSAGGAWSYTIPLDGFSNGSCAQINITVTSRINGGFTFYDLRVISKGTNYPCGVTGANFVERVRWENM